MRYFSIDSGSTGFSAISRRTRGTLAKSFSLQHRSLEIRSCTFTLGMSPPPIAPILAQPNMQEAPTACGARGPLEKLDFLHRLDQVAKAALGVAVEHSGHGLEEQRVLQTGESLPLPALEHHHGFGTIDFDNRHPGNRTFRIVASVRVNDIVRADDYCNIRGRKFGIDLFHFVQ